ncbi:tetratricopeptide repeat protein [Nocardia yamanashiensis]|uniref:tetratricopeptide repeat protein n=1 Tax=Nocardia yamanashiensis TaxID=209247 RepID=UPI00082ED2F3|nr:tetratricopeptide repeat protein [Nocardia yamanashiensis]
MSSSRTEIDATLTGWLYRPFFDLGAWNGSGNLLVSGLVLAARAFDEGSDDYARPQISAPASIRHELTKQARLPQYDIGHPGELRVELRTPLWQKLCDHLDAYRDLDEQAKLRTLWLLHRASFHEAILQHENYPIYGDLDDQSAARLFMRGLSRFHLMIDGVGEARTLDELRQVENMAQPGSWAHIEATYFLANANVKYLGNIDDFRTHLDRHLASIEASGATGNRYHRLASRYHRIAAMLPQLEGKHAAMSREMDRAAQHCGRMERSDPNDRAEWEVLQYALLESRVKEYLLRGDLQQAEDYARLFVEHVPADPRARLTLGQVLIERGRIRQAATAYEEAVMLGPQVSANAYFMLGQCLEALEQPDTARLCYLHSLTTDPQSISAAEALGDRGLLDEDPLVRAWLNDRLADLHRDDDPAPAPHEYQRYSGVLGKAW